MLQETFEDKISIITPIEKESRGCQGERFPSHKGDSDVGDNFGMLATSFECWYPTLM